MDHIKEQVVQKKRNPVYQGNLREQEEDIRHGQEGMDAEGPSSQEHEEHEEQQTSKTREDPMRDEKLIEVLNGMLSQEHACAIRYVTHAAVVTGPYAETIQARFKEIAADETSHAERLRDRILALGGMPTVKVNMEDLKAAKTLQQMLSINIEEEQSAIRRYSEILTSIPPTNAILFQAIQTILSDEQEHLEELITLKSTE